MQIIQAKDEHFFDVKKITQRTIQEIYPHYYPRGVVDFFFYIIMIKTLCKIYNLVMSI